MLLRQPSSTPPQQERPPHRLDQQLRASRQRLSAIANPSPDLGGRTLPKDTPSQGADLHEEQRLIEEAAMTRGVRRETAAMEKARATEREAQRASIGLSVRSPRKRLWRSPRAPSIASRAASQNARRSLAPRPMRRSARKSPTNLATMPCSAAGTRARRACWSW